MRQETEDLNKLKEANIHAVNSMISTAKLLNLKVKESNALFGTRNWLLPRNQVDMSCEIEFNLKRETIWRAGIISIFIKSLKTLMPSETDICAVLRTPIDNDYFDGRSILEYLLDESVSARSLITLRDFHMCECYLFDDSED